MGLFHFLIVVQAIIAAALVATILMQQSEGGGLGMGGSPSGMLSARGAANFLTRATSILATLFVVLAIGLAFLAARQGAPVVKESDFKRTPVQSAPAAAPAAPVPAPQSADPAAQKAEPASSVPLDK